MIYSATLPAHTRVDMLEPTSDGNYMGEYQASQNGAGAGSDEASYHELMGIGTGSAMMGSANTNMVAPGMPNGAYMAPQSMSPYSSPANIGMMNNAAQAANNTFMAGNRMFNSVDFPYQNFNFGTSNDNSMMSSASLNSINDTPTVFGNMVPGASVQSGLGSSNYYGGESAYQSQPSLMAVNSVDTTQYQYSSPLRTDMGAPAPGQGPDYNYYQQNVLQPVKKEPYDMFDNTVQPPSGKKRYRVIRGISAGGCSTRPPKQSLDSNSVFLPVELELNGAGVEDICYPNWSPSEKEDRRRIIRIERIQNGPHLIANFSIVGAAKENPTTLPPPPNANVIEVSCLECTVKVNEDNDSSDDEHRYNHPNYFKTDIDGSGETYQYYITSVEVVGIVELLIGTQLKDPAERRRERGRVRSNLVPFWSKKPISSRMSDSHHSSSVSTPTSPTNQDYRVELAKRIMGYEIRKPRGFDKEVRILRWDKLIPALKRALQSYYTEIPQSDAHLDFN